MFIAAQKTTILKMHASAGQALIELAVFGAIFLIILSVLIRYGIQYNLQQKAEMTTFRRALAIASTADSTGAPRGRGSYAAMRDVYLPDVQEPLGSVSPAAIGTSASVIRDPLQHMSTMVPSSAYSDMQTAVRVNSGGATKRFRRFKNWATGYRIEYSVPHLSMPKYVEIYGNLMVKDSADQWTPWNPDAEMSAYKTICLASHQVLRSTGGEDGSSYYETICDLYGLEVRVDDVCLADIPDYASCYDQAHGLVDEAFCRDKCIKSGQCNILSSSAARTECRNNCTSACAARTNPPNQINTTYDPDLGGAWYAARYESATHTFPNGARRVYTFPVLDSLFGASPTKKFGLGADGTSRSDHFENQTFHKAETPAQYVTQEAAVWNETTYSNMTTQENVDDTTGLQPGGNTPDGYAANVGVMSIPSEVSVRLNQTWQTNR